MPMYKLLEFSSNHSKDEATIFNADIASPDNFKYLGIHQSYWETQLYNLIKIKAMEFKKSR